MDRQNFSGIRAGCKTFGSGDHHITVGNNASTVSGGSDKWVHKLHWPQATMNIDRGSMRGKRDHRCQWQRHFSVKNSRG